MTATFHNFPIADELINPEFTLPLRKNVTELSYSEMAALTELGRIERAKEIRRIAGSVGRFFGVGR